MTLTQLFEELFAGKRVTISFPTDSSFTSFYSQIRTAKSRYESKFKYLFDESLTDGKVVRVLKEKSQDSSINATFYLGEPIRAAQQFTILSIAVQKDL